MAALAEKALACSSGFRPLAPTKILKVLGPPGY